MLAHSTSQDKIQAIAGKHAVKTHFIPVKYRILGGLLQSMNIQFGNFLEKVIANIVALDPDNEIMTEYSGKSFRKFRYASRSFELIDQYLDAIQAHPRLEQDGIQQGYEQLLSSIIETEDTVREEDKRIVAHDIDLLFRRGGRFLVYAEIKYNDDHDTGKFVDINRKLLKTYVLLINEFRIRNTSNIKPVLLYFNDKLKKINPYLPEHDVIYRGPRFFDEFTSTAYSAIESAFARISESREICHEFDLLTEKILGKRMM